MSKMAVPYLSPDRELSDKPGLRKNSFLNPSGKVRLMRCFFAFFFVSGFCSLLYEIVWLRLAMAQFGVTSALVSIVLSMFMAGLGLGSWAAGRALRRHEGRRAAPALRLYAMTELLIGISALMVPRQLLWGRTLLEHHGLSSSSAYYLGSGLWIALTLVPWCACMGATIPIAMEALRQGFADESQRSFSFLYLANVLGAVAGTAVPLVLIELYGFRGTLKVGATLNGLLAASAMWLSLRWPMREREIKLAEASPAPVRSEPVNRQTLLLLFLTGLTSMGIEVVWIRQFTPYLTTVVYAFASILGLYLLSTYIGSQIYRRWSRSRRQEVQLVWALLGCLALLPLITANPSVHLSKLLRLALGIAPFSGLVGFLTPMLVDRRSRGDPGRAGSAYAVNVIGCIVGPLLSGFLLLPVLSERWVMFVFALPWLAIGIFGQPPREAEAALPAVWQRGLAYAFTLLALGILVIGKGYEDQFAHRIVLRDHTATIIATGEGMDKKLLVNGYGITGLAPSTKVMAHLPLAFLNHPPHSALVVCFGMGTTYRSLLSWGIPVTAVELVPSVPRLFWYYHADAAQLLQSPFSHVVIDDGRRYLERTAERYDVITLDPPPPVQAAGSSLLYSKEFYAIVRLRLQPGGILQQWLPYGDAAVQASAARALKESFPHVRVFHSPRGSGLHFLASSQPIASPIAADLIRRMPVKAVEDLMEWGPQPDAESELGVILQSEFPLDQMIAEAPQVPALADDRPENEYYVLRRWLARRKPRE